MLGEWESGSVAGWIGAALLAAAVVGVALAPALAVAGGPPPALSGLSLALAGAVGGLAAGLVGLVARAFTVRGWR
jgi:hypothetical protein